MRHNLTNVAETQLNKVDSFYIVGSTTKEGLIEGKSNVKIDLKKAVDGVVEDAYNRGFADGQEGSSSAGLAEALTKLCAWDSQVIDDDKTHFKPDAFIVADNYWGVAGVVHPYANFSKADGEDYYVVGGKYGGSDIGPTDFYTWDELNAAYERVVYDGDYHGSEPHSHYLYDGNINVNHTIIPLYKKSTIDTQAAGVFGELYVPQIRVNGGGVISSAKEYHDDYSQSTVTPTFTAVTLMVETEEDGETVQTMYYMWIPNYDSEG